MALSHPILTTDNTPTRSVNAWTRAVGFLRSRPWMVAVVASLLIVLVLLPLSERNGIDLLISNVYLASFIAVAALGQMLVVSTGRGAIDLSIPFTITLCVYIATIVQNGTDDNLLASIGVTVLVGTLVGAVNGFAVVVLRVPAMVATLAVGFIAQSVVQIIASTTGNNGPSPAITAAARGNVFGIPIFVIVTVVIAVVIGMLVFRTGFGLRLVGTGQNDQSALLAGLRPGASRWIAFALSGGLAATAAIMLGGYSGGASLGIGASFLISTIAAVVLGGTLMSGGSPSVAGTLAGALLLTLLLTLTNTLQIPSGTRSLIEGLVILTALGIGAQKRQ
jgi:ribose transport system permease protein